MDVKHVCMSHCVTPVGLRLLSTNEIRSFKITLLVAHTVGRVPEGRILNFRFAVLAESKKYPNSGIFHKQFSVVAGQIRTNQVSFRRYSRGGVFPLH